MSVFSMPELPGTPVRRSVIDRHTHVCDLLDVDGPLLQLYRDAKTSWFYLWCDTNGVDRNRWLVFTVSRPTFARYISKRITLRDALLSASQTYCLQVTRSISAESPATETQHSRLHAVSAESIASYLPAEDSFFEEDFAPDISLAEEVLPTRYKIPIGGDWFIGDLDRFSSVYTALYAFFYSTKPRFVRSVETQLRRSLHAPWQGGFSRINLFDALAKSIPSMHDMRVTELDYASPGEVELEALGSVGADIKAALDRYINNQVNILDSVKALNTVLSACRFRKRDLSTIGDEQLGISAEHAEVFAVQIQQIAGLMQWENQLTTVRRCSPNNVVTAKALLAVMTQLGRLADYEHSGMLNLTGRGGQNPAFAGEGDWLEQFG